MSPHSTTWNQTEVYGEKVDSKSCLCIIFWRPRYTIYRTLVYRFNCNKTKSIRSTDKRWQQTPKVMLIRALPFIQPNQILHVVFSTILLRSPGQHAHLRNAGKSRWAYQQYFMAIKKSVMVFRNKIYFFFKCIKFATLKLSSSFADLSHPNSLATAWGSDLLDSDGNETFFKKQVYAL